MGEIFETGEGNWNLPFDVIGGEVDGGEIWVPVFGEGDVEGMEGFHGGEDDGVAAGGDGDGGDGEGGEIVEAAEPDAGELVEAVEAGEGEEVGGELGGEADGVRGQWEKVREVRMERDLRATSQEVAEGGGGVAGGGGGGAGVFGG
ncbi:hypothetical protein SASPL_124096 [Salvia splendens]|uniref:Uncharacterized protein n=1 Tax=Salvia splendens TaxID=180675 RepID=A0A8X8XM85_SALSN|nr:hypothetical protein SASPL_124096 [Salvia splendens]